MLPIVRVVVLVGVDGTIGKLSGVITGTSPTTTVAVAVLQLEGFNTSHTLYTIL